MARTVTLGKLKGLARLYADQRPGGADAFVPDEAPSAITAGLEDLINSALAELYDLLVAARGHEYYRKASPVSIVANTAAYSLPADFYELLSVTLEWGSSPTDFESVEDIATVADRVHFQNWDNWGRWQPKGYRLLGTHAPGGGTNQIEFLPTPSSAVTARLQYVPTFTDLAADADVFDGVNGWEKLVALRVAMELRMIEEQPYSDIERMYEREKERIENLAADRAASAPKRVRDVTPEGYRRNWPPLPGRVIV